MTDEFEAETVSAQRELERREKSKQLVDGLREQLAAAKKAAALRGKAS